MYEKFWAMMVQSLTLQTAEVGGNGVGAATTTDSSRSTPATPTTPNSLAKRAKEKAEKKLDRQMVATLGVAMVVTRVRAWRCKRWKSGRRNERLRTPRLS